VTSTIEVRSIETGDVEAAIALDQHATGQSRRGFFLKRFANLAAHPDRFVWLVAVEAGDVAGFVSAHLLDGEYGGRSRAAVIDAIAIRQDLRGTGVGATLTASLEAELRRRGVAEIRSEADWTEQGLVTFFARAGFQLAPQLVLQRPCLATAEL
jgi:N-acetylglutamate synthase-like GNAT family acetyltransferase